MDQPIHLVLVNGLATPQREADGNPKAFFSQLFPHAVIDEFSFIDASSVEWHLHQRARALLEQLWKSRNDSKPLPIVFLAHGLGGFVVKQVLVSAVEEPRYRGIALHASAALFFGVPHRGAAGLTWENLYLRLLSVLPLTPRHPLRLATDLVEELEDVSGSFRTLPCRIDVTNYYEGGERPLIDVECSIMRKQDVSCGGRHDELWHFATGKANAEGAVSQILATRNTRYSLLREFLHTLSILDPRTHRLRPRFSAADTLGYTLGHATLEAWKSEPAARILCISGSPGSGTTTFASRVLGDLLEHHGVQDSTILSFAFSRSDSQARTPFDLYLSLCRQFVSFQPQLFHCVSSAASFWTGNGCFTTENLWILLRSMVTSLVESGTSVYCVICSIHECAPSPGEAVRRMEELVKAGDGRFKLLYTQTDGKQAVLGGEAAQHTCIALDSASQEMGAWKERHIQSRIQDLVRENASWDGLTKLALAQAKAHPSGSPYLLIKVNMILLEWTTKGCTRKQVKEKLLQPPSSLRDCYNEVIRSIKSECRTWVLIALRWIARAVRPLRPTELAVAVALDEILGVAPRAGGGESNDMSELHDMIRRDIVRDLRDCMAPLTKVENNRVSFIHVTFGDFLLTNNPSLGHSELGESEANEIDDDCQILGQCLEYLEHVGHLASASVDCNGSQHSHPADHGYGLLSYATLHWPEHFLKTTSHKAAREHVLQFLQDDKRVSTWAALYQKLNPSLYRSSISVNSPLRIVCKFGLSCLLDDIITLSKGSAESGENLEAEKSECLNLAAEHGHHDIVQALLGVGIRSTDALGLAAAGGFADIVESILAIEPEGINRLGRSGYAPIHHATCAGHKHVVSLLLDMGTDLDIQTTKADLDIQIKAERNIESPLHSMRQRRFVSAWRAPVFESESESETDSDWESDSDSDWNSHGPHQGTSTDIIPASVWSETSLQLAARTGQAEVIELLLSKNADLHAVSSVGYDALKYAAVGGFVNAVTLLLQKGAGRDKPSAADGNTALHLAAAHGHVKVVELLMQGPKGESHPVHMANAKGLTPIHLAAREGHLDVLDSIFGAIDHGKDLENASATSTDKEDRQSSRDRAAASPTEGAPSSHRLDLKLGVRRRSTTEVPSVRTKKGAASTGGRPWIPANDDGRKSALEWAAEKGHCHVVQALLARSAEKSLQKAAEDGHGNTALHIAAKGGHSRTIEELLKNPRCARLFPVDSPKLRTQMTPLHLAAKAGHADVVKTLLRYEAQPDLQDKSGRTALHHAAINRHLRCVDELLDRKSDPTVVDQRGKTALHLAAQYGHSAIVRRVVDQNRETLWIQDKEPAVALDFVVARGTLKEVEEFVRMLEEVEGKDFLRRGSPLHAAAKHRHGDILQFLLDRRWNCAALRESDGRTPLHEAVSNDFLEGVKLLLADTTNCDVNAVDRQGNLPLHCAQQLDIVQTLLDAGAKNDEKNHEEETPSYLAAWRGRMDILQALINSKPKPDTRTVDNRKWTLLHAAYDDKHIVEMLLEHDVDRDAQSEAGQTPLSLALERGHPETAKVLLDAGADPNKSKGFTTSPLYCVFSIHQGNLAEMVQSLVEKGADLLKGGNGGVTALHLAVRRGEREVVDYIIGVLNNKGPKEKISDLYSAALCECVSASNFDPEMAEKLVAQGLDVSKATGSGLTALQAACAKGTVDAVKWLLSKNADINAKASRYGTALCAAVESTESSEEKVLVLLEHETKADINLSNEEQPTPLQRAVSKGDASLVELLLKHKADVNLTKPGHDTPLNKAISRQKIPLEIIAMMLDGGADIHKTGGLMGKLPVHMAAIYDRPDVMERLYSAGANACAKDDDGLSPLMYGLLNRSVSIVQSLLSRGAYDLNETDPKGQTPLMVATILGDKTNLKELLSSGFSLPSILNARDFRGRTALAYAVWIDLLEVVEMLIEHGADPSVADCRGYGPLYWAVRLASQEITEAIIKAMGNLKRDTAEHWSIAIHAAVASGKRQALERLLSRYDVDAESPTPDGWTPLYTALRYESNRMEDILSGKSSIGYRAGPPSRKRPSRWHPEDKHPGIKIDPENPAAFVTDGTNRYLNRTNCGSLEMAQSGMARTDFPMLPLLNGRVYYFEVTLTAVGNKGWMAVGFCDDGAPLTRMLGWESGAWGFHSDDGNTYEDGRVLWRGAKYHTPYGKAGVTIGCGVNFVENTAFYTRDGDVIGRAFTEIRGKLYPAVSINFCQEGWRVSAVFPGEDGKSESFVFKGDCEGKETLVPVEQVEESSDGTDEESEGETSDSWSL